MKFDLLTKIPIEFIGKSISIFCLQSFHNTSTTSWDKAAASEDSRWGRHTHMILLKESSIKYVPFLETQPAHRADRSKDPSKFT